MDSPYTDNDYLLPPPYASEDMDVLGLVLTGQKKPLQDCLDNHLNRVSSNYQYRVLTEIFDEIYPEQTDGKLQGMHNCPVLLTFHRIKRLYSVGNIGGEPLKNRGYFSYKEAVFWVPVFEVPKKNPAIITWADTIPDSKIADVFLYSPLILADNPLAVAGGREIFGLSKRFGELTGFPDLSQADTQLDQLASGYILSLKTDVLPNYSPKTAAIQASIVEVAVSPKDSTSTPVTDWKPLLERTVEQVLSLYDDLEVLPNFQEWRERIRGHLVEQFLKAIRVVALKQYRRGATDYGQSCYTAVNKMKATGTFHHGRIFDNLTIHVTPKEYANISLPKMMGLTDGPYSYMFYANLDSKLNGDAEQPVEL